MKPKLPPDPNQIDIDFETDAYARSSDPDTSHSAAERMRMSRLERDVYQFLLDHYPVAYTSIEIAKAMGKDKWSISPRLKPLMDKGLVERTTKVALNSSGKMRELKAWRALKK